VPESENTGRPSRVPPKLASVRSRTPNAANCAEFGSPPTASLVRRTACGHTRIVPRSDLALRDASRGLLTGADVVRPVRPEVVASWPSLTGSEAGVADLVADGLTNREVANRLFLSHHTVDAHLRHIYRKLGIRHESS
jgi:DNA-binding CsgD family transcriptional regulator